MSGKRPGGGWGSSYAEPAAKKKKETKIERIMRQAAEAAAGIEPGSAKSSSQPPPEQQQQQEEDKPKVARSAAWDQPFTPQKKGGWGGASQGWGQQQQHQKQEYKPKVARSAAWDEKSYKAPPKGGWAAKPYVSEQQRAGQWGGHAQQQSEGKKEQSAAEEKGGKKKESKMERLRRQMLGDAAPGKEGGAALPGDDGDGEGGEGGKDEGEVGGWAAGAEAEGVFEEGEGLMKLKDGKGKGKEPVAKPVGGATKQALLREVVPAWMKSPMDITEAPELGVEALGLDERLIKTLMDEGFSTLFPVQAAVVGHLLCKRPGKGVSWAGERDVCVCAPTGSGKTLSFCVPIVQSLASRVVPRLRALIVVPSRDLASQVFDVLEALCRGCDLRACLCAGKVTYAEERSNLLPHCDVVVATPGRLTEHLKHTEHFTVEHLRFLVMDEADRLLSQSYQGWITTLMSHQQGSGGPAPANNSQAQNSPFASSIEASGGGLLLSAPPTSQLRKLLFSATLTRNPSKLAPLRLRNPVYFAAKDARYVTPKELKEFMVPLQSGEKPLALVHLLAKHNNPPAICFTNSVVSSHRLYRLLEIYGLKVHLFSSELSQEQRAQIVSGVQSGDVQLVICSDAMARGMDLPSVEVVVNYDVPTSIKTYVHRVGRTARAGRSGIAYTLLHSSEVKPFKALLRLADNNYVRSVRVGGRELEPLTERYKTALKHLKVVLDMEKWRELDVLDEIDPLPKAEGEVIGGVRGGGELKEAMKKRVMAAYGC